MKRLSLFSATLVLCLGLSACNKDSGSNTEGNSYPAYTGALPGQNPQGQQVGSLSIRIISASKVNRLVADQNDNPRFYAINGRLVKSSDAIGMVINQGQVACYTRVRNFNLRQGSVIRDLELRSKAAAGGQDQLSFITMVKTNTDQSKAFVVLCLKRGGEVLRGETMRALKGLISVRVD